MTESQKQNAKKAVKIAKQKKTYNSTFKQVLKYIVIPNSCNEILDSHEWIYTVTVHMSKKQPGIRKTLRMAKANFGKV